jgi:hypothetical protein
MGGNAVVGYHQFFDLEGESGIVARGYGTCCTIRNVSIIAEYHNRIFQLIHSLIGIHVLKSSSV